MNPHRFFAPTARDALKRVKEDLGPDAVVLSNRSIDGGVEILAMPPSAMAAIEAAAAAARAPLAPASLAEPALPDADDDFRVSLSSSLQARQAPPRAEPAAGSADARPLRRASLPARTVPARAAAPRPAPRAERAPRPPVAEAPAPRGEARPEALDPRVSRELAAIRGLLERQLAGFAWGDLARSAPVRGQILSELLEAGFSGELARRLAEEVAGDSDLAGSRRHIASLLNRELLTLDSDADIIDRGGVYALVGPTGVGKTTTTAKLAARCVVRHGAERLALLTTDSYRIGAHEQLRIYGRILGVQVHAVRDGEDLRRTLSQLRDKHMVLIDTVGMSQRDRMVAEQASMLLNAGSVRRLLLLNATVRGDTLDDVVGAYSGPDLAGCILSKVDEAVSLAPAIDVLVRHQLDLFYVANGQRVPEDLHLPNRTWLLHRALKTQGEDSPHRLAGDEPGMMMAAAAGENRWSGVARG